MTDSFSMQSLAQTLEARILGFRPLTLDTPWQDEVVFPYYDGLSIANLAQSILRFFGVPVESPLDDMVWDGAVSAEGLDRIVLILSDGLGYRLLCEMIAEDDTIAALVGSVTDGHGPIPLTSTLPSTTAVALPTLWTGELPGVHGMVGTILYLREFSTLVNMLSYSPLMDSRVPDAIEGWGLPAEKFVPMPSLPQRLLGVDVPTHLVLAHDLMGTGLSKILHRGVQYRHRTAGLSDSWHRLQDVLRQTAGQRCYISMYLSNIDTLSHAYGHRSDYVKREIRQQLLNLKNVLEDGNVQDGRTLILFVADHGHYDTDWTLNLDRDAQAQPLRDALSMTYSGDGCIAHVFPRHGLLDRVIELVKTQFGDHLGWIDPQQLIDNGLYGSGPLHPDLRNRVGDLTLLTRRGARLEDRARTYGAKSWHSGLSDWEMLVPLLWKCI